MTKTVQGGRKGSINFTIDKGKTFACFIANAAHSKRHIMTNTLIGTAHRTYKKLN